LDFFFWINLKEKILSLLFGCSLHQLVCGLREKIMSIAVGMVETLGFPAVVEAADAMVKAARVTLVGYEKIGSGRVTVIVRGDVSEVQASVAAGVESVKRVNGGQVMSTHIIARPHENLEYVLPIRYTEDVEQFRENVNAIRPFGGRRP
jgi:carbon dioxide concentrating mechanism protein CcmK